ncbi:urease accessory protein UreE [Magnetospirillum sulfuroxidans]|uniref:Urease accessory protein UreE n=1 Tax=Magnetospirillum sulfuroxidans TaxID=611300 RepID=A0ABS5IGM7_9PROT|nr:urease accessory protein UreE [Magnetospirillum sulfuroxidans]MBR9973562.1 urease accessory protein UreE [Magnetospirillum sulfuroxidans]
MRRALALHPAGSWPRTAKAGTVTLAAAERHRRRLMLSADDGGEFLLDLPRAMQMKDGDGLELDDGGFLCLVAADEDVIDISCRTEAELARICWHIGNRHVAVQFLPNRTLRVAMDHVLMTMLDGQAIQAWRRRAPFQPEPGAYDPHGLMNAPAPVVRRA